MSADSLPLNSLFYPCIPSYSTFFKPAGILEDRVNVTNTLLHNGVCINNANIITKKHHHFQVILAVLLIQNIKSLIHILLNQKVCFKKTSMTIGIHVNEFQNKTEWSCQTFSGFSGENTHTEQQAFFIALNPQSLCNTGK